MKFIITPQVEDKSGQIGGQIGGQITERQNEVLELITTDNSLSRKQLAQQLSINESAVQKHLKSLMDKKIIERVGTKGGHWKILIKGQ